MNKLFITLEGIDGAGKSSNISFIEQWLRQHGREVLVTREPGGTVLAERIRSLLLNPEHAGLSAEAELLLLFAARCQHLQERILPALERGQVVLCERFTHSTYAYQGGGRGLDSALIVTLEQQVLQNFQPDLTLLLDLPVSQAMQRQARLGTGIRDRFHQEPAEFLERVRRQYQHIWDENQRHSGNIRFVDASLPLAQVQQSIAQILQSVL